MNDAGEVRSSVMIASMEKAQAFADISFAFFPVLIASFSSFPSSSSFSSVFNNLFEVLSRVASSLALVIDEWRSAANFNILSIECMCVAFRSVKRRRSKCNLQTHTTLDVLSPPSSKPKRDNSPTHHNMHTGFLRVPSHLLTGVAFRLFVNPRHV